MEEPELTSPDGLSSRRHRPCMGLCRILPAFKRSCPIRLSWDHSSSESSRPEYHGFLLTSSNHDYPRFAGVTTDPVVSDL